MGRCCGSCAPDVEPYQGRQQEECSHRSLGQPASKTQTAPLQTAKPAAVPCSHGEPFNVLRYNLQQKYDSHYDSFGGCTARSRIRWCDAVEWPCCARSLNPCQPAGKASVASSVQPAMLRSCPGLFVAAEEDYGPQISQRVSLLAMHVAPFTCSWLPRLAAALRCCCDCCTRASPADRHRAGLSVGCGGRGRDLLPAGGQGGAGTAGHH